MILRTYLSSVYGRMTRKNLGTVLVPSLTANFIYTRIESMISSLSQWVSTLALCLKNKIFNYTRGNKIGLAHMQELKRILLALNTEGNDVIDLREFLVKIKERNFIFPESFLKNLVKDIKLNESTLSYQKFIIVLNIFYSLPIFK